MFKEVEIQTGHNVVFEKDEIMIADFRRRIFDQHVRQARKTALELGRKKKFVFAFEARTSFSGQ